MKKPFCAPFYANKRDDWICWFGHFMYKTTMILPNGEFSQTCIRKKLLVKAFHNERRYVLIWRATHNLNCSSSHTQNTHTDFLTTTFYSNYVKHLIYYIMFTPQAVLCISTAGALALFLISGPKIEMSQGHKLMNT